MHCKLVRDLLSFFIQTSRSKTRNGAHIFFEKSTMNDSADNKTEMNRRQFCKSGILALTGLALPTRLLTAGIEVCQPERQLSFFNTHTGESLNCATYWANGTAQPDALTEIYQILRDHRCNEVVEIDLDLLDQLTLLNQVLENREPLHIISGYRSPQTNAYLRQKSQGGGVAKYSLHMDGRAIDIRIPGVDTLTLRKAALSLKKGGVGYYPGLKFVHMDTGSIRTWRG